MQYYETLIKFDIETIKNAILIMSKVKTGKWYFKSGIIDLDVKMNFKIFSFDQNVCAEYGQIEIIVFQ